MQGTGNGGIMHEGHRKPSEKQNKKSRWTEFFRGLGGLLLDLVFPPVCPLCERPWHRSLKEDLADLRRRLQGEKPVVLKKKPSGICPQCRALLPVVIEPFCLKCGKPIEDDEAEYCYDCSHHHHVFEQGRALYPHTGPAKRAVYELKYGHRRRYGAVFGREMAQRYGDWIKSLGIGLVLPVPLYKTRLKERGYNQAAEIAVSLAKDLDLIYSDQALRRVAQTKRLKQLDPMQRKLALKGVFEADLSTIPRPLCRNVLLVDDIYTTGSTIDEAAKVLKRAGAVHVYFLTVTIGQGM